MNRTILALALTVSALVVGCGTPTDERPPQSAPIPTQTTEYHIPQTKEEKIAAINKAPISDQQKKDAIAKVNAESN